MQYLDIVFINYRFTIFKFNWTCELKRKKMCVVIKSCVLNIVLYSLM